MAEFVHKPVMLEEVINGLNIRPDGVYVDGTLGGAGHSYEIISKLKNGLLIGIDRDTDALKAAEKKLSEFNNKILYHGNHDDMCSILQELKIDKVDGILLDLGVSSYQLDEASRGFSYMKDSKLDMRMNREDALSAYEVVNTYSESKLESIFKDYGEERYAKAIARKIVQIRKSKNIETTLELVDIIKNSVPKKYACGDSHPAKKVFQAIRIEVNGELERLANTVKDSIKKLNKNGRLAVITFHSLEDRIVKHSMEEMIGKCTCPSGFPVCVCGAVSYGKVITKKPVLPSSQELKENTRAASAKLRIFEAN